MILYACGDLIFSTRISSTAGSMGIASRGVRSIEQLEKALDHPGDGEAAAPCGLIVDLDLEETALNLIEHAHQTQPRLPVLAFGSHVEVQLLREARKRGADPVLPRSAFTQNLVDILRKLAAGNASAP
ncbi:MAG: response regulator transcription factor [Phycisphaeraceae bacterium]|nr:response regulator transcription factor [Phycisphaeraceae bacterium]